MPIFFRRLISVFVALAGLFLLVTFQGWGMALIRAIGFERALGAGAVQRLDGGRVLLTNPLGMLLWSLPFALLGVVLIGIAIRLWRGGRREPARDN